MKKIKLFVLAPLAVCSIALGTVQGLANAQANDVELSSAVTSNMSFVLKNPYQLTSSASLSYEDYKFTVIDQVAEDYRSNSIYYGTYLLQDIRLLRNGTGGTEEEYISLQNEVSSRAILDSDNNPISFDDNYGNPFRNLANLNNSQINSYFTISNKDDGYLLKANDLAYGILNNSFVNFFTDFDGFIWDEASLVHNIEKLEIAIASDGTPTSISFEKIKKDRFGAIKEMFTSTFDTLSEVEHLTPVTPKMDNETSATFKNKLDSFQERINKGNFSQELSLFDNQLYYVNFYDLDYNEGQIYPNMMLSSCQLYDQSYGMTYVGLLETSEGYKTYAISPDAGFHSTMSNDTFTSINEVIPNINTISTDLFRYYDGYYIFDISSFTHADVYFCADILTALFGIVDPAVAFLGLYLSNYSYQFTSLILTFTETGNLVGGLSYIYESQYQLTTTFSFYNIGTTDLTKEESIKTPIDFFISQM